MVITGFGGSQRDAHRESTGAHMRRCPSQVRRGTHDGHQDAVFRWSEDVVVGGVILGASPLGLCLEEVSHPPMLVDSECGAAGGEALLERIHDDVRSVVVVDDAPPTSMASST